MAKIACVYICAVVCICAYAMWAAGVMRSHEITGSSVCVRVPDVRKPSQLYQMSENLSVPFKHNRRWKCQHLKGLLHFKPLVLFFSPLIFPSVSFIGAFTEI